MKEFSTVLVTSLGPSSFRSLRSYYAYRDDRGIRFCDGLSVTEAGSKYILSSTEIDEIIVLGSKGSCSPEEEKMPILLRKWSQFSAEDPSGLTDYGFCQYRISQFLDGLDVEGIDLLDSIPQEKKEQALSWLAEFCGKMGISCDGRVLFETLAEDPGVEKNWNYSIRDLEAGQRQWLMHHLFASLPENDRLSARNENRDITIRFIPISNKERQLINADNISEIADTITSIDAKTVRLCLDMQGLDLSAAYTTFSVLSIMAMNRSRNISIQEIITTGFDPEKTVNLIDRDEKKRFDITLLLSGMYAFVEYDKVDLIESWWQSKQIQNPHIELVLKAMRTVDEGISLCYISMLEQGIAMLKEAFREKEKPVLTDYESNIFRVIEHTIRDDYGALLTDEDLNVLELLRWAIRKRFYQQALTIAESKVPQDLVRRGILYYAENEEERKAFMDVMAEMYMIAAPSDRWKYQDIPHYLLKYYPWKYLTFVPGMNQDSECAKLLINELNPETAKGPLLHSRILDHPDALYRVIVAYLGIGVVRNNINHASTQVLAANEDGSDAGNPILNMVMNGLQEIADSYEACLELLNEDEPFEFPSFGWEDLKAYMAEKEAKAAEAAEASASEENRE